MTSSAIAAPSAVRSVSSTQLKYKLMCAVAIVAISGMVNAVSQTHRGSVRNDFVHYYLGANFVLDGENPYTEPLKPHIEQLSGLYDPRIPVAAHPPLLLRFFGLFSWMEMEHAFTAWVLTQVILALLLTELIRRVIGVSAESLWWWMAVAFFLNSKSLQMHFFNSQVQLLVGCLVVGAYLAYRRGHTAFACVLATTAAAFKLYPLLLMPWFACHGWRNKRDVAMRAVACAGVGLTVLLITGIQPWLDFRELGVPTIRLYADTNSFNYSLFGLFASLGRTYYDAPLGDVAIDRLLAIVKWMGIALLASAYGLIIVRRKKLAEHVPLSLLMILMISLSLVCWSHYMVLLALPCAVLVYHARQLPNGTQKILSYVVAAVALLPMIDSYISRDLSSVWRMAIHYYPLYAQGALAALLVLLPASHRPASYSE